MNSAVHDTTSKEQEYIERYGPGVRNLVSVVIPNFNHARYIGDAIRSVLAQEYPHFEIIVVDDGSTDDRRAVVVEFGNLVQYIWQENQGLSAARNTGIRAARGSFVGVLDADDLYEPNFMGVLVALLKERPEAATSTAAINL